MQEALPRLAITISVVLCALCVSPSRAWAQPRTAPEATQHALDELTNAMAQGKITPTPSPTATAAPTPDPTATPAPTSISAPRAPADTPAVAPTPTEPPLPVPEPGSAVAGYIRPSPRDPSGAWLELALSQGRWAVLYDGTLCAAPAAWTNIWVTLDGRSDRPITVDRGGNGTMCTLAAWSWTSDVPCAADDQGTCDVALDGAYWDALGQAAPDAQDQDTPPPPTPQPRLEQTVPPRVAAAPPPPAAAAPRVQIVVQTVVVVVTAEPPTPSPTQPRAPTSTAPPTPSATRTPPPTNVPTATVQPTATEAPVAAVDLSAPTPAPTPAVQADTLNGGLAAWNWTLTFVILGVALALVAIWLFVLRSGPVMW
jgi:hypothetical protein